MVITGYVDESGIHDSGLTLVSCWLGNVHQWRAWDKEIGVLFRDFRIKVFHAKEWRDTDGEFHAWSVNKKVRFMDDMSDISNRTLEIGCSAFVNDAEYKEHYNNGLGSRKLRHDTRYGVCFRAALTFATQMALDRKSVVWKKPKRTLNVIAECSQYSGDALRIFGEFKQDERVLKDEYRKVIGALSFDTKDNCRPLAVADAAAYHTWRMEQGFKPLRVKVAALKSDVSYKKNYYRVHVGVPALQDMKRNLISYA